MSLAQFTYSFQFQYYFVLNYDISFIITYFMIVIINSNPFLCLTFNACVFQRKIHSILIHILHKSPSQSIINLIKNFYNPFRKFLMKIVRIFCDIFANEFHNNVFYSHRFHR